MAKELKVLLEEDLLDNLNIALQINNDNINDVADKVFRNYIVKTFSSAASKIESKIFHRNLYLKIYIMERQFIRYQSGLKNQNK